MILRPRARPQAILQAFAKPCQTSSRFQCRSKHTVPYLGSNNEKALYFQENGVPDFLTARTFKQTWLQYQEHLCNELNQDTEGTSLEALRPMQLHQRLSKNPALASMYNNAAMAHFNHFWWESLTAEKKAIPDNLRKNLEEEFGSIDQLRTELFEHAEAIFGNGFVWLVKTGGYRNSPFRILCTYNAGSPYSGAYNRRDNKDMATNLTVEEERMKRVQNTAGSFGRYSQGSRNGNAPPNPLNADPILCLNVWQHMWIPDYGVLGKRAYLSGWWDKIDWSVVDERYNWQSSSTPSMGGGMNQTRDRLLQAI